MGFWWLAVILLSSNFINQGYGSRAENPHDFMPEERLSYCSLAFISGANSNEIELTQWRVFFGVNPSPIKTCPK